MIKVGYYSGRTAEGPAAIPLTDGFEKQAAPALLSEVGHYIKALRPSPASIYVLVNAMGAGEYYGSNINGDYFTEACLIHAPDDWTGNPLLDKLKARTWPYGYPTFYLAHPYAHHRNKDPSRAYGEVELAAWNPKMHRVELVVRVDKDKCEQFGGISVWDKLKQGQYPDVSMGCKVPFDTCSICLDWEKYRDAQATFDRKKHKSPGDAVLGAHKALKLRNGHGIRGVSITRADYCDHAKKHMNRILPNGKKVFVYNDYPKFFDISFVFIGADKTAKVMMKIAEGARIWSLPSAELAEKLGYVEPEEPALTKTAGVPETLLKWAFLGKAAKEKDSEIVKDVLPSQFAGKAVPLLTECEPDLSDDLLGALGKAGLGPALSTTAGLGIVLRPSEFQHVVIISMSTGHAEKPALDKHLFSPALARLLLPMMAMRSALGPEVERRVLMVGQGRHNPKKPPASLSRKPLDKIGAAYNGYRNGLMELVASAQELVGRAAEPFDLYLHKLAQAPASEVFTPLSVAYLKLAFMDELGGDVARPQAQADVQRAELSRNTWTPKPLISGEQKHE